MTSTQCANTMINKYIISGVPSSSIPALCKEFNVNESAFYEFMNGQTVGVIGNEAIYYECDIIRFLRGLPNND